MAAPELIAQALACYERALADDPRLRPRPGQRLMADQVARTFAAAELASSKPAPGCAAPEDAAAQPHPPVRAIAVVQAGTGVGKSLAYSAPGMALALARNTRLIISTATVALQEQLVHKDLPALAARFDPPVRIGLAKGRGRYVCALKLERRLLQLGVAPELAPAANGAPETPEDDWFADAWPASGAPDANGLRACLSLRQAWSSGAWDGDFDTLEPGADLSLWPTLAAQASSCSGRHCPLYARCSYFEQRKRLVQAQVIVVNHDLLLSTLGTPVLPELDQCLLVIDEAHHLPATALEQFACRMDLSRLGWIERLTQRALKLGARLGLSDVAAMAQHEPLLRRALQTLAQRVLQHYGSAFDAGTNGRAAPLARVAHGRLPAALLEPLGQAAHSCGVLVAALRSLSKALRQAMRDDAARSHQLAVQYAELGSLAPRLEAVHETTRLLLQPGADGDGTAAVAKWFTREPDAQAQAHEPALFAHASPTLPGQTLQQHLWPQVRAAVLTSATLTSCGRFDFFLRESGLELDAVVSTLEVPSPFDFARQGRLVLAQTRANPRDAGAYEAELLPLLLDDLAQVRRGALVLFTSRQQMQVAVAALQASLRQRVLVQNAWPRRQLLQLHAQRVAAGQASIIFGLQSFGEGLDLPGPLCERLFITKLPFAPPDDPVGQARAEWLRAAGRDAFAELALPAAAMRLAQWVGRAIRSEDDAAQVVIYDRRLHQSRFGQQMLAGLPPFTRQMHVPALAADQALAGGKRRYQAP